jgi:hypothetical protein
VSEELRVELPDELVEVIAQRAAEIVLAGLAPPRWATLKQTAEHLGGRLTEDALRWRARRNRLPGAVKDGSRWWVDLRELDAGLGTVGPTENEGRAPLQRPRPVARGGRAPHA